MEELSLTLLKKARRDRHITVDQAGEAIGMDGTSIWRYESGRTQIPIKVLCRLMDVYNLPVKAVFVRRLSGGNFNA